MSEIIESSEVTEEQITDNEEVTEEVTEEPTEIQEETDEQQETEEKPEEEKEEDFNPENATFEDESLYQIEGYDLTEFKEVVDLGDPEKRQQAESQLKQLKEMGFTQDQIKFLINNAVQDLQAETEPKKELKTQSEVNAYLNKNLDKDTKLNYIPLTRNVKEWFSGSKYEKHIGRMVKDPDFLNMVDYLSKKIKGEPAGLGGVKHEVSATKITPQGAKQQYNNFLTSEKNTGIESIQNEIKRLRSVCIDTKAFDEEFKGLI
mgnify:CR=1 FL=1